MKDHSGENRNGKNTGRFCFEKISLYFVGMGILSACLSVCYVPARYPRKPERASGPLELELGRL